MNDTQILTLALVFVAAIGSIVYNNSRITDLRTDMNGRFTAMDKHIEDKFNLLMERIQRMEDNLTRILGDHETRLQILEGKKQ